MADVDLVKMFESTLADHITESGFPLPPLFALHHNGTIDVAVMAVPAEQIFESAMRDFLADLTVKELIFAMDRYTKPGQGTKYADVLTVFWWKGEYEGNNGFRFGVVNYKPPPDQLIEPIDWDNTFWNEIGRKIIMADDERAQRRLARYKKAYPERFKFMTETLQEIAADIRRPPPDPK